MAGFTYDDTGVHTYYFVAALLAIVLIPSTTKWATNWDPGFSKSNVCRCSECFDKHRDRVRAKKKRTRGLRFAKVLLGLLGWALLAYLAYGISQTEIVKPNIFDPYDILGIDEDADARKIRKAYRKLSLKLHPDKVRGEAAKVQAHEDFTNLSKAYKVLTDDEYRENWEKYGNPDGKGATSVGIALPSWIVDQANSPYVLAVYGILFGVLVPFLVGRWWYGTRNYTKDQILTSTMGLLFRRVDENTRLHDIVRTVAQAKEFQPPFLTVAKDKVEVEILTRLLENVKSTFRERYNEQFTLAAPPNVSPSTWKTVILIYTHFFRLDPPCEKTSKGASIKEKLLNERGYIAEKFFHLIQKGVLQITLARGWLAQSLLSMDLSQLLVQGLWYSDSPLLQLPGLQWDHANSLIKRQRPVRSIYQVSAMGDDVRMSLLDIRSNEAYNDAKHVISAYPRLLLEKIQFKVENEQVIPPGGLVVCSLRLRVVPSTKTQKEIQEESQARTRGTRGAEESKAGAENSKQQSPQDEEEVGEDDFYMDDEDSYEGKRQSDVLLPTTHSPRFEREKRVFWWVFIGNLHSNRIINATKVTDLATQKLVKLQFQAPTSPGTYPFCIIIKSDTWVGSDLKVDVQMPVKVPERKDSDDDDLSDEAQEAALKASEAREKDPKKAALFAAAAQALKARKAAQRRAQKENIPPPADGGADSGDSTSDLSSSESETSSDSSLSDSD